MPFSKTLARELAAGFATFWLGGLRVQRGRRPIVRKPPWKLQTSGCAAGYYRDEAARRWSEGEELRIIENSFSGRRLVPATARAHGVSRSLLTT